MGSRKCDIAWDTTQNDTKSAKGKLRKILHLLQQELAKARYEAVHVRATDALSGSRWMLAVIWCRGTPGNMSPEGAQLAEFTQLVPELNVLSVSINVATRFIRVVEVQIPTKYVRWLKRAKAV